MKKILEVLIVIIAMAAIGFALIHPYRYYPLEKENRCSCHSLNPQTTPLEELVFDPLVIIGIATVVVGLVVVAGITVHWLRQRAH